MRFWRKYWVGTHSSVAVAKQGRWSGGGAGQGAVIRPGLTTFFEIMVQTKTLPGAKGKGLPIQYQKHPEVGSYKDQN